MMFIALWFELNAGKKAKEIVLAAICCHIDFHFTSSDTCLLCMSVMKKLKTKHLTGIIKLQCYKSTEMQAFASFFGVTKLTFVDSLTLYLQSSYG